LTIDAVLKLASCTKLITSISALQLVERGLVSLDEPISKHLPEISTDVIAWEDEDAKTYKTTKAKTSLTLRHLLTHSSGLAYQYWTPILQQYSKDNPKVAATNAAVPNDLDFGGIEKTFIDPLLFDPGQGWSYGPNLDWVGVLIRRLTNKTLKEYFDENIFKPLGLEDPLPVFNLDRYPDISALAMGGGVRNESGGLDFESLAIFGNGNDEYGGHGLSAKSESFLAILQDIVSDKPKLLSEKYIVALYTPQLVPDSAAHKAFYASSPFYDSFVRGVSVQARINHALGGIIVQDELPEYGQPAGVLTWAGLANTYWQANREKGVASWFATQIMPFTDPLTVDGFNHFRKDFWAVANSA
jgi:CubicO group peptidase (beta-lactamase class C family)